MKKIFVTVISLLLLGCSGGGSDNSESNNISDTALLGTWSSTSLNGCISSYVFSANGDFSFNGLDRVVTARATVLETEDISQNPQVEGETTDIAITLRLSDISDNMQADCNGSNDPWFGANQLLTADWIYILNTRPMMNTLLLDFRVGVLALVN